MQHQQAALAAAAAAVTDAAVDSTSLPAEPSPEADHATKRPAKSAKSKKVTADF